MQAGRDNMKLIVKTIILRAFNWLASCNVTLENLPTIRLVSKESLQLTEQDLESVQLVIREELRVTPRDVESVRLVLKGIDLQGMNFIRFFVGEGASLAADQGVKLFDQLRLVALSNRLDEIGDISEGVPLSYAQEGESLILERYFDSQVNGFFVDVGAHHPKRFSNTYSFYKRGWRGVNIDPTPGVKELFDAERPADISFGVAVSDIEGLQDFYMFSEPALNTFSRTLATEYQQVGCTLLETKPIETKRLSTLLEQCHIDRPIDFMSIDVEDHELPVLQSNDWSKFRPRVLLVEILNFDMKHPESFPVHRFILDEGYELFAKTCNTLFYKDGR